MGVGVGVVHQRSKDPKHVHDNSPRNKIQSEEEPLDIGVLVRMLVAVMLAVLILVTTVLMLLLVLMTTVLMLLMVLMTAVLMLLLVLMTMVLMVV